MSKIVSRKLKIMDMHCTSCAMLVDGDLEELDGVFSSKTNFAKGECLIEVDEEVVSNEQIVLTVKETGYTALIDVDTSL